MKFFKCEHCEREIEIDAPSLWAYRCSACSGQLIEQAAVESHIDRRNATNPILEIQLRGVVTYDLSFSLGGVEEDSQEWLKDVLTKQVAELVQKTERTTRERFQKRLRDLAGVRA